ncbi:MAG: peptidylprolyl isomerase [Bacteroides sp.]|nr:peptidylprolyl isomerase [Barnesiella sp.]MBD5253907.1 peptidylprolyl isomerase [Barnesiella sp.]MBD5368215.1 peptidylprolyl isomerase [Bacteroides sp.]
MNMKIKNIFMAASFITLGMAYMTAATDNVVEEVAWVVGDQPIWKSEIEEAYQNALYEKTDIKGDPYCVIPEQLAIEKLYLHQAELDTVEVADNMVISQVDAQINYYINNLGSAEKVEQVFHKPINAMRETLMEMVKNRTRISQVQRNLTSKITSTPAEVRRYFDKLPKDSVPFVPAQVEVQILTLAPAIPRQEIEDIKARLRDFSDRVNRGESDFFTLAVLYSDDPGSASRGGELGFMGRSQLVPEFASVAFNLNDPKKVSKIVETEFGYHIIQLIEKRGDRINCRHILLKPKVAEADLIDAMTRLDSLRTDMVDNKKFTFEEAVAYVSQDKDTRNSKGVMVNQDTGTTRFQMSELPQEIARVVATLQPGEVSKSFIMKDQKTNQEVVAIVKLTDRIDAHRANLGDDFQQIKDMYENSRRSEILTNWLRKKIAETYVRIEDGWRDCEFINSGWIKDNTASK